VNRFFLTQNNRLRLRIRIAFSFVIVGLIVSVVIATSLYFTTRTQILSQIQQRALLAVKVAVLQQDGDLHATLRNPGDENSPVYQAILEKNTELMKSDPDISSIFTMRFDENGNIYFVTDVVRDDLSVLRGPAEFYEPYPDPSDILAQNIATMRAAIVEDDIYSDSWGNFISAYAPFYRSDGTLEAIIGVDISANAVFTAEESVRSTLVIAILVLLPILNILGLVLGSLTSRPIEAISENAKRIIDGDFSQDVKPGVMDEIGELAVNFNKMSEQLRLLIQDLENQVAQRTQELTSRGQELASLAAQEERRANQLQAIAQVSTIINAVQNTDELLPRITQIISEQFGYYHVGIFLISEDGRWAVLIAANSEGGQKMLARNHQLRVGGSGIVGYVTGTGLSRIALDVGEDAYFFDNPDLPNTRSEMAVPLSLGKKTIGALDVQSQRASAFSQSDVELLSILADQVSVALENARVFEETQKSLAESQSIYRQYLKTQWREFIRDENKFGYRYSLAKTESLKRPQETPEMLEAQKSGDVKIVRDEDSRLAVPIKLRGEVIGVLGLKAQPEREWTEDEMDIIRAVVDRVAIAVENARLVTQTQRKAAREETIGQITSKISASVNMRNILQTTAEELGRALPGSEVVIQLREQDNNTSEKGQ
jgi:GAF domain-containing protein/HAMP domain-containing protein